MRITQKGQVTIPQEIRDQLGLRPDTEVAFEVDGNAVRITRAPKQVRGRGRALVSALRGRANAGLTTEQIMALTRGGR